MTLYLLIIKRSPQLSLSLRFLAMELPGIVRQLLRVLLRLNNILVSEHADEGNLFHSTLRMLSQEKRVWMDEASFSSQTQPGRVNATRGSDSRYLRTQHLQVGLSKPIY